MSLFQSFSTKLQTQKAKILQYFSVVALNVAFSVVFDEATDTDSEDTAKLRPSFHQSENGSRQLCLSFGIAKPK